MSTPTSESIESADTPPSPARPRKVGMTRTLVNFWLDTFLLMAFVALGWVSAVLQFVFPARTDSTGWTLWGGDVVAWRNLQFAVLSVLATGIVLHVMLHWSWVCGVLNKQLLKRKAIREDGSDTLVGVALIAVVLHILAIGVLLASWSVKRP